MFRGRQEHSETLRPFNRFIVILLYAFADVVTAERAADQDTCRGVCKERCGHGELFSTR